MFINKKKIALSVLLLLLLVISTSAPVAEEVIKDENLFIQKFTEAIKADDHARMKELVKRAEIIVNRAVISRAEKGIRAVAEGKDGSGYFNLAESIAAIYTMEFKKEGLLKLLKKYRVYDKEMCEEKLKGDALIDEGFVFYKKGKLEEALSSWKEALKIFENLVDWNGKSRALNNIAAIYDQFGQRDKALSYYEQGLVITRMIDNKWLEATILINIGEIYLTISKHEGFLNSNLEALKLFERIGDEENGIKTLKNIARAYEELKQYDDAIAYFQKALALANKHRDLTNVAQILNDIGVIHFKIEKFEQALQYHTQALEFAEKIGDTREEAYCLGNIGNVYLKLYQYKNAFIYLQKAMEKFQKVNDLDGEIAANINIAKGSFAAGLYEMALNDYKEALDKIRKAKNLSKEAEVLLQIGFTYKGMGEYRKALEHYHDALKIFKEIKDNRGLAGVLMEIGTVHENMGKYANALDYYKNALELTRIIKDISLEATVLGNIGILYKQVGRHQDALTHLEQSLEKLSSTDINGKAVIYLIMGNIYDNLGDHSKALEYYDRSIELCFQIKDVRGASKALGNKANIRRKVGQYDKAVKDFHLVLEICRKTSDLPGEATTLNNLGVLYYRLSDYLKAIQIFQEAIKISEKIGGLETIWRSNIGLGQALWASGKPEEATSYYKKSVEAIEELYLHTTGLSEEERSSMIGEKINVYQEFIELLLELHHKDPRKGYDKETFLISEKSKSRVFQELMAKAGARTAFSGDETFKKMVEKEQQFIGEINNLRTLLTKELSKPEKEQNQEVIISLKGQVVKAEQSLNGLEKEIEAKYPRYADLKRPKPLTVEELQNILKPDETLISYAIGKDKIAAFVIGKKSFKLIEIDMQREEISKLIKRFRRGLEDVTEIKHLEKFKPEVAYELYQKVFYPLSSELKGIIKLYISADDILYTLPFEALVDREINEKAFDEARERGGVYLSEYATLHYLIDTYTITYLPSASVLRSLRKFEKPEYGKWQKPLIAFADPIFGEKEEEKTREEKGLKGKGLSQETELTVQLLTRSTGNEKLERLKESAQEAEAISKEVKGKKEDIYLREKATEENIYKTNLKGSRYLLFSTHGLLGGDFSGVAEPALALTLIDNPPGRDGFLTMSEVLGLDLNAELIILSACNTSGKGDKTGSGEGFAGLTRSFMYAGSKALLVTHWSVESEAARDLMVNTIRLMKGKTKPETLRDAKLTMKSSNRQMGKDKLSLSHPFFWAPFVLVGEGE